jgi:uncharacterized protein (UPF0303 family)
MERNLVDRNEGQKLNFDRFDKNDGYDPGGIIRSYPGAQRYVPIKPI